MVKHIYNVLTGKHLALFLRRGFVSLAYAVDQQSAVGVEKHPLPLFSENFEAFFG
jgi:hypothetical protein